MLNEARIKAKTADGVADIIREIKIFDAILHAKVAWDAIEPETIIKCFKHSDVDEKLHLPSPPSTPTYETIEDPEFAEYFESLLDISWDQYLAMDEALELESPCRAPDAQCYSNMDHDHEDPSDIHPPITIEESFYLQSIQKSNLDDLKLFELLEAVKSSIQNKRVQTEVSNKTKQSSIVNNFKF